MTCFASKFAVWKVFSVSMGKLLVHGEEPLPCRLHNCTRVDFRFGPRQIRTESALVREVNPVTRAKPYDSLMVRLTKSVYGNSIYQLTWLIVQAFKL